MLLSRSRGLDAVSAACKRETAPSEVHHLLLKGSAQSMAVCLRGLGAFALLLLDLWRMFPALAAESVATAVTHVIRSGGFDHQGFVLRASSMILDPLC
jgi:hypothetical protein